MLFLSRWLGVFSFAVAGREGVEDGNHKVDDHQHNKLFKDGGQHVALVAGAILVLVVQFLFLLGQNGANWRLQLQSYAGYSVEKGDGGLEEVLIEGHDHEHLLDVHLDDRLPDQGGPEEGPEGHQEVPAGDARQVEEWVGYGCAD